MKEAAVTYTTTKEKMPLRTEEVKKVETRTEVEMEVEAAEIETEIAGIMAGPVTSMEARRVDVAKITGKNLTGTDTEFFLNKLFLLTKFANKFFFSKQANYK